ncbi:MAG: adenine deaminase, partial [Vallitaleaceae bacterium]|nr:adenine deaminase [Vallitaleaceae bacterium]
SNSRRCLFCTDDKHPQDLLKNGHIDHNIRLAIQEGLDPIMALQMATINAAECYHLTNVGAIAPAYFADIVIFDNLKDLNIMQVFKNGQLVAKDHRALFNLDGENDEKGYNKVNDVMKAKPLVTLDLQILLKSEVAQVIKMIPHSIVTQKVQREVAHHLDGTFKFDHSKDIIKMAVIERHKGLGNIGLGLVEGFGLKNGAIALTIAHDSHNLIVIGDSDESMILAANRVIEVGGGIAICSGNEIRETLRLPIGGIMSNVSMEEVSEILLKMMEIAHKDLGVSKDYDPFMTLAFMALPVIPEIKLTDMGLFDVTTFSFIDISV